MVTRCQLLDLGLTPAAVKHRVAIGRLHPLVRGVYAVGRPHVERKGLWLAAVLACGAHAVLSHRSAAALWEILPDRWQAIDVTVPSHVRRRRPDVSLHRRADLRPGDLSRHRGIPVTSPVCTLIDLATCVWPDRLEAAVNEADKRDLVDAETLRLALDTMSGRRGAPALRRLLDRRTFTLTDSELERRFLPLARRAGLGNPLTGQWVNGFKVDFFWPELGLVVETDGLRYHRTPAQQARDRLRDQAHAAAGLTPLRFTHAQVRFEPGYVQATLTAVGRRLGAKQTGL